MRPCVHAYTRTRVHACTPARLHACLRMHSHECVHSTPVADANYCQPACDAIAITIAATIANATTTLFKHHAAPNDRSSRYGAVGEKFDPNLHDALFQMVNEELEVGDVGAVLKCGYSLNDRVIRPAQVGAIKAP